MAENFQNFYVTKLREACDAVATTIYVDTVPAITEGTLVIEYANSTKHEIIHFTGVSGYGLTGCTRGMEGTTAQSHSAGVDVRQNLTAGMIDKIINGVITTENIADSAVTTAKINDGAVTADKIDFTTLTDSEGWTVMNCGSFKIYTKKGTRSVTVNGGAWKSSDFSNKPTDLNLSNKWGGICCGKVDDNAITITGYVNMENGKVEFTQVNHYSGNITTTSRWSAIIIEFL